MLKKKTIKDFGQNCPNARARVNPIKTILLYLLVKNLVVGFIRESTSTLTELFRIVPVLLVAWVPQVTVVSVLLPGLTAERDALAFVAFRACGIYTNECETFWHNIVEEYQMHLYLRWAVPVLGVGLLAMKLQTTRSLRWPF